VYVSLGFPWSLYCGVTFAYGVLIIGWTCVVLAATWLGRVIASAFKACISIHAPGSKWS
jgi:hypothetical protein